MATQSSILAWKIPWIEEPGGLQSMGSQRAGYDFATEHTLVITALSRYRNIRFMSQFLCLSSTCTSLPGGSCIIGEADEKWGDDKNDGGVSEQILLLLLFHTVLF